MTEPVRLICIWPCGTWCEKDDVEQYQWMSDDYKLIPVSKYTTDETIESLIQHLK